MEAEDAKQDPWSLVWNSFMITGLMREQDCIKLSWKNCWWIERESKEDIDHLMLRKIFQSLPWQTGADKQKDTWKQSNRCFFLFWKEREVTILLDLIWFSMDKFLGCPFLDGRLSVRLAGQVIFFPSPFWASLRWSPWCFLLLRFYPHAYLFLLENFQFTFKNNFSLKRNRQYNCWILGIATSRSRG